MKITEVYIGSDHAGFPLKKTLKEYIAAKNYKVIDLGTFAAEPPTDYPDVAGEVAEKVHNNATSRGVLVCGTGIGMCMTANKTQGIRGANCESVKTVEMSRKHNDSNILCLGGRVLAEETAKRMVDVFLITEFENEERHVRRVAKIDGKK